MKQYEYTAQCEGGAAITGAIEAADSAEALKELTAMRLGNIDVRGPKSPSKRRPIGSDDFIFFNEQLAALANTGMCLDAGLRQLGKDIQSPRLRRVLTEVADDIEGGQPLDQALEKHAAQMPALYARVVRAGVQSGQLPGTLLNLSHHLRLIAETRRLVAEALAYPAIVLTLALAIVSTVIVVLIPQFEKIFVDFDVYIPALTMLLIGLAHHVPHILICTAIVVAVLIALWLMLRLSDGGRMVREKLLLRIPVLGSVIRNSIRARFLRAIAFSVNSGIPLPEALRLSADATASPNASKDADHIARQVEQGESVYTACLEASLIPPMFGYVVEVNTDRNNLEDALIQLSQAYESRAAHGQSQLRTWLAPLAVIAVGLIIGTLVLAMFLPLTSLIQSVSG